MLTSMLMNRRGWKEHVTIYPPFIPFRGFMLTFFVKKFQGGIKNMSLWLELILLYGDTSFNGNLNRALVRRTGAHNSGVLL